jgi:unsaturated chondroitin disaccharide hydrolase
MKFLLSPVIFFAVLLFLGSCANQKSPGVETGANLKRHIDQEFRSAAGQYALLMKSLPPDKFPRNYDSKKGSLGTSGSDWWCSGFYPGTLLYLFEQTKDSTLYKEALRIMKVLEKEKDNTSTHDLGFMMYCSFGNAVRVAPQPAYNEILLTSAKSLATRFNPTVGCIKSWDSKPGDFLVIIDNMMNLELLFWATRFSGDSSFYKIAVTHANTTMANHFRTDNSSYHVLNYDVNTGKVKEKKTAQGYADASAWARGQAWGLYGYTATFRETKDKKYLEQATKIADFLLDHPNLPAGKIPYWDFNDPAIPNALRDASAGAITASALLELSDYVEGDRRKKYFSAAETMLQSLSASPYKADAGTNGGFIIQHGVGHLPAKSEVDVALTYGDYYYIESLIRYKKMVD